MNEIEETSADMSLQGSVGSAGQVQPAPPGP